MFEREDLMREMKVVYDDKSNITKQKLHLEEDCSLRRAGLFK